MKDKILDIVAEHCVGWKNCEALTEKLFDLYSVSHQRELLIAYNVDFYKGIHDVTLKDIEHKVDKYLSNLKWLTS